MKPELHDSSIRMPITFDYSGGRSDNRKSNILTTLVLILIAIVLTILFIRNENAGVFLKIIEVVITWAVVVVFVRFRLMQESMYSDAYEALKEIDFTPSTDSFWNIYEIDEQYPYICHFKNGLAGIFIRLEKDVVVGKPSDVAYTHYEAISDAYNVAGSLDINMAHIDYMDNVGNDARLRGMYESLDDCENPDMKEAMLELYANLQDDMSQYYASYDVYLFTTRLKQDQLWYNVRAVIDTLLRGNYISYSALDIDGIRATCVALFNLTDFSAKEACANIFKGNKHDGLIPLEIATPTGVKKLNKSSEEKRQERAEAEANKGNKKTVSKKKPVLEKPQEKPVIESEDVSLPTGETEELFNMFTESTTETAGNSDTFDMNEEFDLF